MFRQDGDSEEIIQEAMDTCPVDCIHWVDYTELKELEKFRKYQKIKHLGFPQSSSTLTARKKRKQPARNPNIDR